MENVCNSKQKWNNDISCCECKTLINWTSCKKGYIWNPNKSDCECDKTFKIDVYFNKINCACKKHIFDELVLTCKDEILNTIGNTSIVDKNVIDKKIIGCFPLFHL